MRRTVWLVQVPRRTRNVGVVQPRLVPVDLDEAVGQRGASLAQRLHLGAGQDEPGLVGVDDRVVVPCLLVPRHDLALAVLGLRGPSALLGLGLLRYVHSLAHSADHFRTDRGVRESRLQERRAGGDQGSPRPPSTSLRPLQGLRVHLQVGGDAPPVDGVPGRGAECGRRSARRRSRRAAGSASGSSPCRRSWSPRRPHGHGPGGPR